MEGILSEFGFLSLNRIFVVAKSGRHLVTSRKCMTQVGYTMRNPDILVTGPAVFNVCSCHSTHKSVKFAIQD